VSLSKVGLHSIAMAWSAYLQVPGVSTTTFFGLFCLAPFIGALPPTEQLGHGRFGRSAYLSIRIESMLQKQRGDDQTLRKGAMLVDMASVEPKIDLFGLPNFWVNNRVFHLDRDVC
jgi:hypothetical protein